MKLSKVLFSVAMTVMMLFSVAVSASPKKLVLGFAQIGAESGWRTAETGSIKAAAKAQGITLKFSDAKQKQENQIKAIESTLTELNAQKTKLEEDLKNAWNSAEAIKKIQEQINAINASINSLISDKNTLNSQKVSTETQITSKTNDINYTFNNLDPLSKSLADWNNSLTTKQVLLNNNLTCSGNAEVVMSQSSGVRFKIESLTQPPTA